MDTNFVSIHNCTVSHSKRQHNYCCENLKIHVKVYETILVLYQTRGTHNAVGDSVFWEATLCTSSMVPDVKKDGKTLLGLLDP
jgi:hypothetical protein